MFQIIYSFNLYLKCVYSYLQNAQQESDLRLTLFRNKMIRQIAQLLPWHNWLQGNDNMGECYRWVSHAPIFAFFFFKVISLSHFDQIFFLPSSKFIICFHHESLSILVTLYLFELQEVANNWLFFTYKVLVSHSLTKYVKPNFNCQSRCPQSAVVKYKGIIV